MTLSILLILIVAVGAALVAVILIQQTQTGGMSAFTGGASGSVFGAKGSTGFLFKMTAGLMIAFAVLCVMVASVAGSQKQSSAVDALTEEQVEQSAPALNTEADAKSTTDSAPALETPSANTTAPALDEKPAETTPAEAAPSLDAEEKKEADATKSE